MTTFFNDPESNKLMHDVIHQLFGKRSGLFKHEYMVHFDPDLRRNDHLVDYIISAGKTVHIAIRSLPTQEYWDRTAMLLRDIFVTNSKQLREFLRPEKSLALVRKSDAMQWYALSRTGVTADTTDVPRNPVTHKKGVDVHSFTRKVIISVCIKDKRTGSEATVEVVNGDVFTAQDKALKILYGEEFQS